MLLLVPGCNISECLCGDLKREKFHGVLDLPSCEQKSGVVNICTDEGSCQDEIGKEPFREHSLLFFSPLFFLFFSLQVLWALGKHLFKAILDAERMHVTGLVLCESQSASTTSDQGRGHLQGVTADSMAGWDSLTSFCDTCLALMICRRSWISAGCLASVPFNFFCVIISENVWRICEFSTTMKNQIL